ncbi:MAG: helicase associated domain-containing protein [Parabacteroides sp.]
MASMLFNHLPGRSVYEGQRQGGLAYHPAIRAPKNFKGFMEFEVTGFLSDIRARVDDMLAELDAWPVMYERLTEYQEREAMLAAYGDRTNTETAVTRQRIARKTGTLSEDYILQLDRIGFEWEVQDGRWMNCLKNRKAFTAIEHTAVPNASSSTEHLVQHPTARHERKVILSKEAESGCSIRIESSVVGAPDPDLALDGELAAVRPHYKNTTAGPKATKASRQLV